MNQDSAIANAPGETPIPVNDARYASSNIRLSAALCALGFSIRLEAEPVTVSINAETQFRTFTFWHTPTNEALKFKAVDVDAWWRTPGRYEIEGYDDALQAMRRVHEEREWIIGMVHGRHQLAARSGRGRTSGGDVATHDLHIASCIKAFGIPLVAFERREKKFIFPSAAIPIAELLARPERRKVESASAIAPGRPLINGRDVCLDWMLESLRYRDFLHALIRQPGCIPLIEMRDGDRTLQVSSAMPERDRNRLIAVL